MAGNNQIEAKIRIGAQLDQALAEVAKLRKEMKALSGDAKPDLSAIKEEAAAKRQAAQDAAAAAKAEAQAKRQAAQEATAAARAEAVAKRQAAQAAANNAREETARAARVAASARVITRSYEQAAQQSSAALAASAREAQAAYDRAAENAFLSWRESLARIRRESSSQALTPVAGAARLATGGGDISAASGQVQQLKGQLLDVRNLLATLFAVQVGGDALMQVTRLVDAYNGMVSRLKAATQSQKEFDAALQLTRGISATYSQSLTGIGRLVERIYSSIKPLGGTLDNASVLVESLAASLRLSGASAEESASAITQFSQALGRGVLSGDELTSVFESAPRLIYALAEALGKSTGELKKMGEEGRLTTAVILEGLNKALPQLRAQAAQVAPTIGEAFTGVGNAFQEYVGKSENVRAATTLLIDGLNTLAQNIGPLVEAITALGVVLATVFIGRIAAATVAVVEAAARQLILAAAARTVAAEMGIAAIATTGMTASLAGPVGLIAAVGALTFAWIKMEKARQDARNATVEGLEEQRGEITTEIAELEERTGAYAKTGYYYIKSRRELQDQLDELDGRINEKRTQQDIAAWQAKGGARGGAGVSSSTGGLRDTAAVEAFENENQTRNKIVAKYAEKRKAYELAKDRDIAAARARNDEAMATALEAEKLEALARAKEREDKELRGLVAASTATRVAQAKQLFDKELQLQIDAAERARRVTQEQFDAGLLDLNAYFDRRAQLERQQSDRETAAIQQQLDRERQALAINQQRRGSASNANEREGFDQAIEASLQRINQLEAEITKQKRNQVDQQRTLAIESARVTQAIEEQLAALDEQIARSKGFLTDDQIAASAARQVKAISDALARLGTPADEIMDRVADLTRLKTVEAQLGQLRQQYQLAADQLATAEQSVANARNSGSITAQEAEARILQLRREQLPVLDALLQRLRALATSPEQKAEIDKIAVNLDGLRDLRTEFEKTAQQQVSEAGSSIFKGLVTQSESAVDLVRNALRRMAEAALDLIAQQLGQQLAQSLFPQAIGAASGGGGGVASFLAALFHSGGVVGAAGGGTSRSVPLSAWALAPRFHTGGLVGDEVPIIAKRGEEVLTEQDPRHVRNFRGGIGNVSITTNVEAAGGDAAANQAAGEQLGQRVRAEVDAWALEQSRPGGILSGS